MRWCATIAVAIVMISMAHARADDWPQWMGPERDGVWREGGLVEKFPAGGAKIAWRVPVAGGYSGPAVADGKVFVADYVTNDDVRIDNFDRKESSGNERVLALDEASGRVLWTHQYRVKYTVSYPAGPRCTPTFDDGKVYTLGSEGHLFCLDANTGGVLWSKDFNRDYNTKTALWGYSGHPLVDGDKLICIVGGEGSFAVAFDKNTGAELWRALTSPEQGYSRPTIMEIGGRRQLILARPDAVSSLDPETGRELWSTPYESDSGLVVMTPVLWGEYLFMGGYKDRNVLLQLAADGMSAELVWKDQAQLALSPVNVQPMMEGDIFYGVNHDGRLTAVKLPDGERLWQTVEPLGKRPAGSGTAFLTKQADSDRYWLFTENGELIIARLTTDGYEEIDRTAILKPTNFAFGREVVWCSPAFANGRMYVRNDEECVCVDLSAR